MNCGWGYNCKTSHVYQIDQVKQQGQTYNLLGFNVILCCRSGVGPVVAVLYSIVQTTIGGSRKNFI